MRDQHGSKLDEKTQVLVHGGKHWRSCIEEAPKTAYCSSRMKRIKLLIKLCKAVAQVKNICNLKNFNDLFLVAQIFQLQ